MRMADTVERQVMQSSVESFGSRWMVALVGTEVSVADKYVLTVGGVPDRCVVWELAVLVTGTVTNVAYVEFGWADRFPGSVEEWTGLAKMFPAQGVQDGADWAFVVTASAVLHMNRLKVVGPRAGMRPVMRIDPLTSDSAVVAAYLTISGAPSELK